MKYYYKVDYALCNESAYFYAETNVDSFLVACMSAIDLVKRLGARIVGIKRIKTIPIGAQTFRF